MCKNCLTLEGLSLRGSSEVKGKKEHFYDCFKNLNLKKKGGTSFVFSTDKVLKILKPSVNVCAEV